MGWVSGTRQILNILLHDGCINKEAHVKGTWEGFPIGNKMKNGTQNQRHPFIVI